MDSDLYIFDGSSSSSSVCHHSSSTEPDMFSSDPTSDFFFNNPYLTPIDDQSLNFFDDFTPTTHHLLSSSPPIISHTNTFHSFESFDAPKTEHHMFNSSVMEDSSNFQNQNLLSSPGNSFLSDHMRRVYSTGDLQISMNPLFSSVISPTENKENNFLGVFYKNMRRDFTGQRSYSSPLEVVERSPTTTPLTGEEESLKVERRNAEERKEKISKYRAKRTQRNFTRTIKYACRKTLADSRPRVRGRFARNNEVFETPKADSSFTKQEENDLWNLDELHEEEETFGSSFVECQSLPQLQMQYTANSFW